MTKGRALKAGLALCLTAAFGAWPTTAHEPITTKILFNKEVVRVLQKNCLGCHKPGGIAPWSLATYEEARPWAKAIKEELLEKRMPPWPAVKGFGDFRNAPPLTQREIDVIVNWVEGGAPPGKPEDLPPGPIVGDDWPLGKPDMVLKPGQDQRIAADADEYRIFSLPIRKMKEEAWVTGVDLKPGNGTVVHCAEFSIVAGGAAPKLSATWVPGHEPFQLPEGFGMRIGVDASVSLRIHYRGSGEEAEDRSAVGLYLARSAPAGEVESLTLDAGDFVIPKGSDRHRVKASATIDADSRIVAVIPSMMPLTASLEVTAYRPDGTAEVLIWVRGQRFHWQPTYVFKRPVSLPPRTRLELTAYFNNSDTNRNNQSNPPEDVRWSEARKGPLCVLLLSGQPGKLPEHSSANSKGDGR